MEMGHPDHPIGVHVIRDMPRYDPKADYYEILQVHPQAHQEVIKRAYRTIVGLLQAHPDLGGTHEDAVRVNEAYQVLTDPEARKTYDTERERYQQMIKARVKANGNAETVTAANGATRTIRCAGCGARNRLPVTANPAQAICGKCRAPLAPTRRTTHAPTLPAGNLRLPPELKQELYDEGELLLQRTHMPVDHQLRCLRCGHGWVETSPELPAACPRCKHPQWGEFRVFRCRHCGHQFTTADLTAGPYHLFGRCPACAQSRWHAGFERKPLSWLRGKLSR